VHKGFGVPVPNTAWNHEDVWMTGGILRCVVNVGARSMREVNLVLQPLYLRWKNLVPIDSEAKRASDALWMHARKDNVRITYHWGVFVQPLLKWNINKYYIFWVCVRSLRWPACSAHAPHCHLCPVRLCSIFPHYLIDGTVVENKFLNIQCLFLFSLRLLSENFEFWEESCETWWKMCICLHVKFPLFLSNFNKT
jgi:hypothetical protein